MMIGAMAMRQDRLIYVPLTRFRPSGAHAVLLRDYK